MKILLLIVKTFFKRAPVYRGTFRQTHRWYKVRLSEARSSDNSAFFAYFKKGTVNKTVVYFAGGGASWNEHTAKNPTTLYRMYRKKETYYSPYVRFYLEALFDGLTAENDPRNPFNDWNYIYFPYSTGDLHIGNNDFPYTVNGHKKILRHHGAENVRAALKAAPKTFFDADRVLITGDSAGGFGALAWTADLIPYFPSCPRFTLLADGAQTASGLWDTVLREVWKTDNRLFKYLSGDGQFVRDCFLQLNKTYGDRVTCLHAVSPYDVILTRFESDMNGNGFSDDKAALEHFHTCLSDAVRTMTEKIPSYRVYVYNHGKNEKTGATGHTILREPAHLYGDKTDGFSVSDWVKTAAQGKDVPSIGINLLKL